MSPEEQKEKAQKQVNYALGQARKLKAEIHLLLIEFKGLVDLSASINAYNNQNIKPNLEHEMLVFEDTFYKWSEVADRYMTDAKGLRAFMLEKAKMEKMVLELTKAGLEKLGYSFPDEAAVESEIKMCTKIIEYIETGGDDLDFDVLTTEIIGDYEN